MLNNPRDTKKYLDAKKRIAGIYQQFEQSQSQEGMFTPSALTPPKTNSVSIENKEDEITKETLQDKEDKAPGSPGADVPETESSEAKAEIVDDVDDLQEQ